MRDIVSSEDGYAPAPRSIRNISVPPTHRHEPPPRPPKQGRIRWGRVIFLLLLVVVVCGALGAGISVVFAGATIVAHPKVATIDASTTLAAALNAPVGILPYQLISNTQTATTTVPATGTKHVSRQATGVVTITSTYSASQRLIAGTRLQAPDGKIYKLGGSVTLPANSSVTATINAESPGSDYNRSGATTFTFPAYKGDPRYSKFSAKSTQPIKGGFVGEEPAVADADLKAAQGKLEQQLQTAVNTAMTQNIPKDSTAIPGTLAVSYSDLAQTAGDNGTATLVQSATAQGALVRVADLAAALARKKVTGYKGESIAFADQGSLSMVAASSSDPASGQIVLLLSGQTILVWQFDPNALKQAIVGKDKSQFQTVVDSFAPAIASATASLRPFWYKNFPSDPNKITVTVDTKN